MQIILNQVEIEDALRSYVLNQISVREGQEITFDFKATRDEEGLTATVHVNAKATAKTVETPVEKPAGKKAEPKPNISLVPEDRKDPSDDESTDAEPANEEQPAEDESAKATSLFAGKETSAAPATANADAKSLFANLQKPVNGAAE